jgi:VIT1/CCC1 family predicted Fe2+/Mn2+ transporter
MIKEHWALYEKSPLIKFLVEDYKKNYELSSNPALYAFRKEDVEKSTSELPRISALIEQAILNEEQNRVARRNELWSMLAAIASALTAIIMLFKD